MTHLFTPRKDKTTLERYAMQLNDEDMAKVSQRKTRYRVLVTDQNTGIVYRVRDAACSLRNCHCDAVVIPEKKR